jgi:hypothetical protein
MSISIERAAQYFKTRTTGQAWNEYATDQKEVAIAQARRDLSRALGRAIRDDEDEYKEGDRTRDEFAVYEQALYTMLRDMSPKLGGGVIPSLDQDEAADKTKTLSTGRGKWSAEALAWLAKSVTTECVII